MNLADSFRAKLAERKEPTARISLPIPELGADFTFEFVARRVDTVQMLYSGMLPERLAAMFLSTDQKQVEQKFEQLTPKEQLATFALQRKMAAAVCVEPRLVHSEEPEPGELRFDEIPHPIITALFLFALKLSPGVPVEIEGADGSIETTTVGAVEAFPSGPGPVPPVLPDGAGHQESAAVGAPAVAG